MELDIIRLLVDFGFMILIWAVQLVIYPSFRYYSKDNLVIWHRKYTQRVTLIVLPLMFSQLGLAGVQLFKVQNFYTISSIVIISVLWLLTFQLFVPLHQQIDRDEHNNSTTERLVKFNWWRTLLWTLSCLGSLVYNV